MYKGNGHYYRSGRKNSQSHNHVYRMLFAAVVVFLVYTHQASALSPQINSHASFDNGNLSSIGSQEHSDLLQLVNGLRAFSREDYALANRLLTPLANKGISEAQFYMGMMSDAGLGTKKDVEQAYLWYQAAARGGHPNAQHNLAVAYAQGEGVAVNPDKAIFWWKKAANQGNADAQYNLGIVYAVGKLGVNKDMKTAMKWWHKAAQSGDGMAQYNLGILYANGKGAEKSYCEATRWWQKSVANGVSQAGVALEVLKQRKDYQRCW
jgi:TPR repeat protein